MGNYPHDDDLKFVEEKKEEDRDDKAQATAASSHEVEATDSNENPADANEPSDMMLQEHGEEDEHQQQPPPPRDVSLNNPEAAAMQQYHQAQTLAARQLLLEHAVVAQQQHHQHAQAQQTQLMTSSLNSLQLNHAPYVLSPQVLSVSAAVPPFASPQQAPTSAQAITAAAQIEQQVLAQRQAAAQAAALNMGAVTSSQTVAPLVAGGISPLTVGFAPGAAITPTAVLSTYANQQGSAVHAANLNTISAAPLLAAGVDPIAVAPLLAASGLTVNPTAALSPTNAIVPPTPTSIPPVVTATTPHHAQLSPQMTIPHYVPPIPPTWGAQIPALSVQDRPLVPPCYNGINPNYPGAQLLHAHPPIFAVDNFLTHAECDFLIEASQDAFQPAPVVGRGSGEVSPSRTSSTCYLAREDLPEYLRKVSLLTGKPAEHCELPQVGRYYPSQQYLQHFDAFDLSNEDGRRFASNGGQRTVTVLVYLNDVPRGGATAFPNLNVEVQPRRGMALVFFPSTLDGLLDKMALHSALPAVDVKYVSQVWIRQSNYEGRPSKRLAEPMVAGLQERRDAAQKLLYQQQLAAAHAQAAQQQMQQHAAQVQQHQQVAQAQQGYQQMSG